MTRLLMIAAFALFGFLSTLTARFAPIGESSICVPIGAIPACEVLLAGYSTVFASTLMTDRTALFTFMTGWIVTSAISLAASLDMVFAARFAAPFLVVSGVSFMSSIALGVIWTRPFRRLIIRSRA